MSISIYFPDTIDENLILNLSNGNFKSLMDSLGFNINPEFEDPEFGYSYDCGQIQPKLLNEKLLNFIPELAIRIERKERNFINSGLTLDQINRYVAKLTQICEEAMKAEKVIYWG